MHEFATKIVSQQNNVNFWLAYMVFWLAYFVADFIVGRRHSQSMHSVWNTQCEVAGVGGEMDPQCGNTSIEFSDLDHAPKSRDGLL